MSILAAYKLLLLSTRIVLTMKFGVFSVIDHYPAELPRTTGQFYQELLEQVQAADGLGFDSFWVAEHHIPTNMERYRVPPSGWPLLLSVQSASAWVLLWWCCLSTTLCALQKTMRWLTSSLADA